MIIYKTNFLIFFISILFQFIFAKTNIVSNNSVDYQIVEKHPSLPFSKIQKDNKYGIKGKENILLPIEYDAIIFTPYAVQIIKKDNKYGIYNFEKKKIIISPIYKKIYKFKKGFAKVIKSSEMSASKNTERVGLINQEGEIIIIPEDYNDIKPFQEGLAAVKKNNRWGFINKINKVIIPYSYDKVSYFRDGYVRVKLGKFIGLIDKQGKSILPPIYDKISKKYKSNFNLIRVIKNGKKGWVTKDNLFFKRIEKHSREYAKIYQDEKVGIIDKNMKVIVAPVFDEIKYNASFKFIQIKKNGKWGYIDKTGRILISPIFDRTSNFKSNGKASVIYQKKMGFIDHKGNFTPAASN